MSKSKQQEAEDAVHTRPKVDVSAVEISPNPAALTDSLRLKVDFHLEAPVANGVWHIEYLADCVTKHPTIDILSNMQLLEATDYARGPNEFQFSIPQIDVSGIQSSRLTNCGLLIASLKDDNEDIMDLRMVIQVSEQRGVLQRIIYSPLE
ncbi:unnamed protein product [Hyaloperonospora brassicae]|uniref:Uncharacterized protein n=1 Tax=Hyaloperonospora brassicae TaxID=162125 RepID=A0AAV0V4F4_HYABA|nr:unnamed protein product [Hyaloperonospora brassicae]